MYAQTTKAATTAVLRPTRLNFAGWCMYCFTRNCADARCIAAHAATAWAICPTCDGSECSCRETLTRCDCTGGLVEIERPAADVIELAAYTAEAAEGY